MKLSIHVLLLGVLAGFLAACVAPGSMPVPTAARPATVAAADPTAAPARPQMLRIEAPEKPDIPDLPRVLAAERLREMGYIVELIQFDDNLISVQAVDQGSLDLGNVSNGIAWSAIQQGGNLVTILDDITEVRMLLATADIQTCADLAGKQVAVSSLASTQALLVTEYVDKNCPGTEFESVVISGSANRVAALVSGQVGAAPVDFANYLALERQGNTTFHVLVNFAQEFPGLRSTGAVVRRDWIEKYPETVRDMIRAVLEARRKLQDPAVLADYLVRYVDLEPDIARTTAEAFLENKSWDVNGSWTPEMIQVNLNFFERAGALRPGLKPTDVADLGPLNAVLDEIGRK